MSNDSLYKSVYDQIPCVKILMTYSRTLSSPG